MTTYRDLHSAIAAVMPNPMGRAIPWYLAPRIRPVGRTDVALVVTVAPDEWASRPRVGLVSAGALTTVDHSVRLDDPRVLGLLSHCGLWEVVQAEFDPDARYDWGLWRSPDGGETTLAPLYRGPCAHRPGTCDECAEHELIAVFESCVMDEARARQNEVLGW